MFGEILDFQALAKKTLANPGLPAYFSACSSSLHITLFEIMTCTHMNVVDSVQDHKVRTPRLYVDLRTTGTCECSR